MFNDSSAQSRNSSGQNLTKKNTISVQSYGKAVPRAQKVNFSISQYYYVNAALKDQEKSSPFIEGFITNNFRLFCVPNYTSDLPNEKAVSNGTCPINVKKIDIQQVMIMITRIFGLLFWHGRQLLMNTRTNKISG
jgi:hypothetical protein